jgi:porphyrinogen peroxidase
VDGQEVDILRDNMPFANAAAGEFGTYFIGYARAPWVTEQMLQNMFFGRPEGNYDRILDFSTATTGTLFFVPSLPLLERLADVGATRGAVAPLPDTESGPTTDPAPDGSLGIGGRR